jgi:hypothetical protein
MHGPETRLLRFRSKVLWRPSTGILFQQVSPLRCHTRNHREVNASAMEMRQHRKMGNFPMSLAIQYKMGELEMIDNLD